MINLIDCTRGIRLLTQWPEPPARLPVRTKADMYRRLAAGEFGNTNPMWFDYSEWSAIAQPGHFWGVRHASVSAWPGTRLNVKTEDVEKVIATGFPSGGYQISPMIWQYGRVLVEGDVSIDAHGPYGLVFRGHRYPEPGSWRTHMKTPDVWTGVTATTLLRSTMSAASYDDLQELLVEYPDHVVEVSVLSTNFGTCPGRNAIVWENRRF